MKKSILLLIGYLLFPICLFAQLSTRERPVSFDMVIKQMQDINDSVATITMPTLDMTKIEEEDLNNEKNGMPPRYGYPHKVAYSINNSGTWKTLANGDKLWQLHIICPKALSINFLFDKFWLPEGGKLFVYSPDYKQYIGAFTSKNNKGDSINVRGFATEVIFSDEVTLEYYQPKFVTSHAIISIRNIVQGYKSIDIFGHSGGCQVNVNCPEGQNWQHEKKAVAFIANAFCNIFSGSLLNTTDNEQKPYLLTGRHCLYANDSALHQQNLDLMVFYWNYEESSCDSTSSQSTYYTTSGATILADNIITDFILLKLTEDPKELPLYTPYYLGWDNSGDSGSPGVCIHHPNGDSKKISTVLDQPTSTNISPYNNVGWKVYWAATPNGYGTTESGSSGSPLLSGEHKVIGQLRNGASRCDRPMLYDTFGKFSISWTGNGDSISHKRLDCWLDSLGTGLISLEGVLLIKTEEVLTRNEQLYSNIRITSTGRLTIQGDIELMGNSRVIVESGGELIIDGGTLSNANLVLKSGATLRIINNGIIELRNGFEAPLGTIVDIDNGQIL